MYEPQIIVSEQAGSLGRTVHYLKDNEQTQILRVTNESFGSSFMQSVKDVLRDVFLPHCYPESVSPDYFDYQVWDTVQAFCSTITGTFTTRAILKGVGVGNADATPLAAAITWVVKDGTGMIGRILFAWLKGNSLDGDCKKWRLCADFLNDAAMFLELLVPYMQSASLQILCATTAMKSIVGVAGGATRASITQHQAIKGNMADVSAKDGSQETFVNLVASMIGILLLALFPDDQYEWFIFVVLTVIHLMANYFAVNSLVFSHLNETRLIMILKTYLRYDTVPSPKKINEDEPVVLGRGSRIKDLCSFNIKIGRSLKNIPYVYTSNELLMIGQIYKDRNYLLLPDVTNRVIYIALQKGESSIDVITAYFHAVLLAVMICNANEITMNVYSKRQLHHVTPVIRLNNIMKTFPVNYGNTHNNVPLPILTAFDSFAQQEIIMFFTALKINNWNIDMHAINVGAWRCEWKQREVEVLYKKER